MKKNALTIGLIAILSTSAHGAERLDLNKLYHAEAVSNTWNAPLEIVSNTLIENLETDPRELDAAAVRQAIGNDPELRGLIQKLYGKEALKLADTHPRLFEMFNGQYEPEVIRIQLALLGDDYTSSKLGGAEKAAVTTITQQMRDYAPTYRFVTGFLCYPLRYTSADVDACRTALPTNGKVPVYVSQTFRPSNRGGGTYSYWINYHVFYGHQQGYPSGIPGVNAGEHGDDWETTSVHIVNGTPAAVQYRVHGSGVSLWPWKATTRSGTHPVVYPGKYFHGGYPETYGGHPVTGPILTWHDVRNGSGISADAEVLPCSFSGAQPANGDACNLYSRIPWDGPMYNSKDTSAVPKPATVDANYANSPGTNQLCFFEHSNMGGSFDCLHQSTADIGPLMNDRTSSLRWKSNTVWDACENTSYGGRCDRVGGSAFYNDKYSSFRKVQ
ncbi:MAG: peptidase inhibitor family I36 protein [Lysobacterales bacterium]